MGLQPLGIAFATPSTAPLAQTRLAGATSPALSRMDPAVPAAPASAESGLSSLPLAFIENQGQVDSRVAYYVHGTANNIYLTREGIVFSLSERQAADREPDAARWAVRLDFEGANPDVRIRGRERAEAVVSYFRGRPSEWKTGLPTFAAVVYEDLWPGIDLLYGSEAGRPKYSFVVEPGADPARIRLVYRGASAVRITEAGRLSIETPVTTFEEDAPYSYQEDGGTRIEVASAFALEADSTAAEGRFGFRLGSYDPTKPLVIDPPVLVYCGYIGGTGGNNGDQAMGVAVDAAGAAYVVGETNSADFPFTVGAYDTTYGGRGTVFGDAFVAKVNAAGTALVYATYIGGTQDDIARSVAVDSSGNAYVTGETNSTPAAGFPVLTGPDITHNGNFDAFVLKLNATGTALTYSGYIGGTGQDRGRGVALDGTGAAYVLGTADSDASSFPVTAGAYDTTWSNQEMFIAKVPATGAAPLTYCTYLGSGDVDYAGVIAVDVSGNAYVTGYTANGIAPGYPTLSAYDSTFNGGNDAVVTKLNATGTALVYSTFLGGTGNDYASGIAIDAAGNAYVVGQTWSSDFPRTSLQAWSGGSDGFVTKINSTGTALVYSGFIGGSTWDAASGIAVDGSGSAYISGSTDSTEASFPETGGPDLSYNGGYADGFVARVNPAGTALLFCTYLGGSGDDYGNAIAVNGQGAAFVVGTTTSTAASFPETVGPDLTHNGPGSNDAFVAKIQSAVMQVKTGQYVGNGGAQSIAGLGFAPDYVMIASAESWGRTAVVKTRTMTGNVSNAFDSFAYAPLANRVTSLDADGFTVGHPATHAPNDDVTRSTSTPYHCANHNGVTYYWTAFQAADGEMKVESYLGDGNATKDVAGVGFPPDYLIVFPASGARPTHRSSTMTGNINFVFDGAPGRPNQIVALQADGFRVGSTGFDNFNASGATYHYVAWRRTTGRVSVGSYAGNNAANRQITGVGFRPELLTITPSNTASPSGTAPAWSAIMKAGTTGAYSDYAQEFIAYNPRSLKDWIHALESDGFRVARTGSFLDPVNKSTDTYHWAAFGPFGAPALATNHRSVGTNATATTQGTVTVVNGSVNVTGGGATPPDWVAANRGLGDSITITGQGTYTIAAVNAATSLALTSPFTGTDGTYTYSIGRKFNTIDAWRVCVEGAGSCGVDPSVTSNLVTDNRAEVGVLYKDTAFTGLGAGGNGIVWLGESNSITTDATHNLTLTAVGSNRHSGVAWNGSGNPPHVVLDGQNLGTKAGSIYLCADYTRVEWLEVRRVTGSSAGGIKVDCSGAFDAVGLRIENVILYNNAVGLLTTNANLAAGSTMTVRNSIVHHNVSRGIHVGFAGLTTTLQNVTVFGTTGGEGIYTEAGTLTATNVVSMNNSAQDFRSVTTQSYNISQDASGSGGATGTGSLASHIATDVAQSSGSYVVFQNITTAPYNLHLKTSTVNKAVDTGTSLLATALFRNDIDDQQRPSGAQWDIGADELNGATAVELVGFRAAGLDAAVRVEWETAAELDNLGFHLYRGSSPDGPWTRLNPTMIPGLGSSPEGRQYQWTDSGLVNGSTHFYRLEDVDRRGGVTSHGPVSATPLAGAQPGDGGGGGGEGGGSEEPPPSPRTKPKASWKPHGEPERQSLRVLERTASGVTLELLTGGFYSEEQPDGTTKLVVPGFFDRTEPGRPTVPTRRLWQDALVGRDVRLVSVEPSDLMSFSGLRVPLAGRPVAVSTSEGTYEASALPVSRAEALSARAKDATSAGTPFPASLARVHQTAFQGERKKAYVELSPLRVNETTGRVVLARRLLVRLAFTGTVDGEHGKGSLGRRAPVPVASDSAADTTPQVLARFATTARGLHAVSFSAIPGLTGPVATSALRLSRLGASVPFHVEPRTASFGPSSTLYFLSDGTDSAYGNEAVFELSLGSGGLPMPVAVASARRVTTSTPLATLRHEGSFEADLNYLPALTEARDVWVWDSGLAGNQGQDYPFTAHAPALVPETARLRVDLEGGSDTVAEPDHHVLAFVNGSLVGELRFDGMRPATLVAEVPTSLLHDGANTLRLENAGDTGSTASFVYLDRFSPEYPRPLTPTAGVLEGKASQAGRASLEAAPGSILLDTTGATPVFLGRALAGGRLAWNAEANHRYLAVFPEALLTPEVRPAPADSLRDTTNQADWIVVAPETLLPAAETLASHREAQGLAAMAVSLEAVIDEFGYGEPGPHAVRDFLAFAFHRWQAPSPRYVLLLGDASYDPKGHLAGTSRPDLIPSPFTKSTFLWTPADPLYAAVNGTDALPDIAIGRINAATLAEAQAAVQKILDFENAGLTLDGKATLVADNPDAAGDFEANQDEIATLLPSRTVEKLFLTQLGTTATKAAVRNAFDSGLSLMSYVGHGSSGLWATEGILRSPDIAAFAPQPQQPLVLTMTCSNGYFVSPYNNSLSERLVLAEAKGAIASFSPSGLSLNDAAHVYHRAVVTELEQGSHDRLGDLLLAAQAQYAASGAFPELLDFYNLLGDPGLKVQ